MMLVGRQTSRSHDCVDSPEDLDDSREGFLDGGLMGNIAFNSHYLYIVGFESNTF